MSEIGFYFQRSGLFFALIAIFNIIYLVLIVISDRFNLKIMNQKKIVYYSYWIPAFIISVYLFSTLYTTELVQLLATLISPAGILLTLFSLGDPTIQEKHKKTVDYIFLFMFLSLTMTIAFPVSKSGSTPIVNIAPTNKNINLVQVEQLKSKYIGSIINNNTGEYPAILDIEKITKERDLNKINYQIVVTVDNKFYVQDGLGQINWSDKTIYFENDNITCKIFIREGFIYLESEKLKGAEKFWYFKEARQ